MTQSLSMKRTIILGSGSYIPKRIVTNEEFQKRTFFDVEGEEILGGGKSITDKFTEITGIHERRYLADDESASTAASKAALAAIKDSGVAPEEIDRIIVAHNFGDVLDNTIQTDILPALASRVKHNLEISNPACVAYDILFGCPGWVEGMIHADAFAKVGMSRTSLVIGTEALSRVLDPHDRDSMIFADGAGAFVVRHEETEHNEGFLSSASLSFCLDEAYYLFLGKSNSPSEDPNVRYIKMKGRKVYEFALTHVPKAMKECLEKSEVGIEELKKIFIHQANEKLDIAVVKRFYRLYGIREVPESIMPMSVNELGNSSVATIPTLYNTVVKGDDLEHELEKGDVILFASVGAGMNINAFCYRV